MAGLLNNLLLIKIQIQFILNYIWIIVTKMLIDTAKNLNQIKLSHRNLISSPDNLNK